MVLNVRHSKVPICNESIYLTFKFLINGFKSRVFFKPLIEDYLKFFDIPTPAHSNYIPNIKKEQKEKGKRWKKNSI